jgi:hypothetical protein
VLINGASFKRLTLPACTLLLFAVMAEKLSAQRPPPTLGSMGLVELNLNVPNAIITWGYWGLHAFACKNHPTDTECAVKVGNSDSVARILCVYEPWVRFAGASDSLAVEYAADAGTTSRAPKVRCVKVASHRTEDVAFRISPAPSRTPIALSVSIAEEVSANGVTSRLTARARIPILNFER